MKATLFFLVSLVLGVLPLLATAQVNSGSNGSDGAFSPSSNVIINMADHPDGIYQYTSVNIPSGVTVTFTPNAANTPVVWLIQNSCVISGSVQVSGAASNGIAGGLPGVGGYRGGNGSTQQGVVPGDGTGPGGGKAGINTYAGNASFGTAGQRDTSTNQNPAGEIYGTKFLVPLLGGSGGAGYSSSNGGGGGGGGAILIAAASVQINGSIFANGGSGTTNFYNLQSGGGGGSGGAIRVVCNSLSGTGSISAGGGMGIRGYNGLSGWLTNPAGNGRIRLDALAFTFSGSTTGDVTTQGFQPIILPPAYQAVSLAIKSVGGVDVAATPTGQLMSPDVIVPASQQNPISVVVDCRNIPLNTEIIVDVKPSNGASVRGVGMNSSGTQAASTATIQVNMPRGGGTIQAKAVSGLAFAAINGADNRIRSLTTNGWTADGERFAKVEVTATLGGTSSIAFLTESGKHYSLPAAR